MDEHKYFNHLVDEPTPNFIKKSSAHLQAQEMQYLRVKGALLVPNEPLRIELLRAFIQRVYYVHPILDIFEFLSTIASNGGCRPISLLLFQAVMLSAIPFVGLEKLKGEGFHSKKQAQSVFFQRVMVRLSPKI